MIVKYDERKIIFLFMRSESKLDSLKQDTTIFYRYFVTQRKLSSARYDII